MIRNRTLVASAAVALLGVGLLGCSSDDGGGPGGDGDATGDFGECTITGEAGSIDFKPATEGTLTAATELPFNGWWNGPDPESINGGFEYCLAANVAHRAGLKSVTVQNNSWDQLISGVRTDYDLGMAAITITDERKQVFDFSDPYFTSNLGVAIRKDDDVTAENIRTKRVGVLQGNLGAQFATDTLKPEGGPQLFQSDQDMFTALKAGQVDAVITDTTLTLTNVAAANGELVVTAQYELDQNYGMIIPKGGPNVDAINAAIADMKEKGTIDALSKQFLEPLYGMDPNSIPFWEVQ